MTREAAEEYLHLLAVVLPLYERYSALVVRREAEATRPMLAEADVLLSAYRRQAADMVRMTSLYASIDMNQQEISAIYKRGQRMKRVYRGATIVLAGITTGLAIDALAQ